MFPNYSVIIGFVSFLTVVLSLMGITFLLIKKRIAGSVLLIFAATMALCWFSLYRKHREDIKPYMKQYAGVYSIYIPYSNFGKYDSAYFAGTKIILRENGRMEITSPVKEINGKKGDWEVDTDGDIF